MSVQAAAFDTKIATALASASSSSSQQGTGTSASSATAYSQVPFPIPSRIFTMGILSEEALLQQVDEIYSLYVTCPVGIDSF